MFGNFDEFSSDIYRNAQKISIPTTPITLTLCENGACGFPSPASDYAEKDFDLSHFLMPNPIASFAVVMRGEALKDIGVFDGTTLIVDRSIDPKPGQLLLAYLDGRFVVRRLRMVNGVMELHPENQECAVLFPAQYDDFSIEGVIVSCAQKLI